MQEELVDCAVAVTRSRCSGHQGVCRRCNESIEAVAVAVVNASLYDGHSHSGRM